MGLDDPAAADGADRRERPQDEGIARPGHDRPLGAELDEMFAAAAKLARLQQIQGRIDLRGAGVELQLGGVLQRDLPSSCGKSRSWQR